MAPRNLVSQAEYRGVNVFLLQAARLSSPKSMMFESPYWLTFKQAKELIAEMGAGGGYILASAKPLMKEVPTENAITVIEEFAQR